MKLARAATTASKGCFKSKRIWLIVGDWAKMQSSIKLIVWILVRNKIEDWLHSL